MKRTPFLLLLLLFPALLAGQEKIARTNTKRVNFGINGGFNSSLFFVDEFRIKEITINEIQNNYKVGYFGSFFVRVNLKRHFLQPEISYHVSNHEIQFDKIGSQHPDVDPDYAYIQSRLHTFEVPLLYGYNFVKSGPYGMAFFGGPKAKFVSGKKKELTFENFDQENIVETLYPINMAVVMGLGVSITNLFFDFRYEIGLHNISKSVLYESVTENGIETASMSIKRRHNVLSFSLGVIF